MLDDLTPEERDEFTEWARREREGNIRALAQSAMVASIFPGEAAYDIQYMIQIGASVLLNKPFLLMVSPDAQDKIPPKLRAIADRIIVVSMDDVDTAAEGGRVAREVASFHNEVVENWPRHE